MKLPSVLLTHSFELFQLQPEVSLCNKPDTIFAIRNSVVRLFFLHLQTDDLIKNLSLRFLIPARDLSGYFRKYATFTASENLPQERTPANSLENKLDSAVFYSNRR